jgi:para-nitrobenzyl esterase
MGETTMKAFSRYIKMMIALAGALLASFAVKGTAQVTFKPIENDPIKIDGSLVSGTYLPTGVKAYLGVPFAAPPIRENRWREPQPMKSWQGVWTANITRAECVQGLRSNNINHYFGDEDAAEDCLYLNMWLPANAKPGRKLPVMVWIYGGAFSGGSASMAVYSGENLAKKGVIYVAPNYRVGIFGFLAHPEATRESGHNASGNWGLMDQVVALKWIQRNIASFGGDPGNVTILGQSAGSMSVNDLQASPLAKGLFHKAIGMSGSTLGGALTSSTLAAAEEQGLKLQAAMKVNSLAQMRTFSSDKVMAAAQANQVRSSPAVDGYFLPKSPAEIFKAGQQNDVPILVGCTANDMGTTPPIRRATTVAEYRDAAAKMYGPKAAEFLELYPVSNDAEVKAQADTVGRESGLSANPRKWAKAHAETGKVPAYLFMFSRVHPYTPGVVFADHNPATVGAYHMGDVPYWLMTLDSFNLFRTTRDWTPYDRDLSNKMSDVIVSFAKTGNPSTAAVKMMKYDLSNEQLVDFGDSIKVTKLNTKGMNFIDATPVIPQPGAGRGRRGGTPAPTRNRPPMVGLERIW